MTVLVATGETGCTLGSGTVTLSGTAADYCGAFSAAGLSDGDGICVTVIKDATNLAVYGAATYHTGSPATITLGTATKTIGTLTAADTVTVLGTAATAAHIGGALSTDTRLSDARTPTAHAASHAAGQADAITPAAIGASATGHTHTAVYPWQMILTPPGVSCSTGYKGLADVGDACTLTGCELRCDPNNKPSAADIVVNVYSVATDGTRTSIFSTAPSIATGTSTKVSGTGVIAAGSASVTAGTLLEGRVTQGSDGQNVYIRLIGEKTI